MDHARSIPIALALAAAGLLAIPALAQNALDRPVDQGVADLNPLSTSTRSLQRDLRSPSGFDRVYRLWDQGGRAMYARASGGLTAVFPRSVYRATPLGRVASIPPGTVYYIGKLPESLTEREDRPAPHSPDKVDPRAPAQVSPSRPARLVAARPGDVQTPTLETQAQAPPNAIFASDETRRRRVESLMNRAIAAVE